MKSLIVLGAVAAMSVSSSALAQDDDDEALDAVEWIQVTAEKPFTEAAPLDAELTAILAEAETAEE